jgi:hypothetical protein
VSLAKTEAVLAESARRQAKTEAVLAESAKRQAKTEAKLAKTDAIVDRIAVRQEKMDRQLAIMGALMKAGIKRFDVLIATQKRTEDKLERFIATLSQQRTNGRH